MTQTTSLVHDTEIQAIWEADLKAVGCLACGVAYLMPADETLSYCALCGAEGLASQPARVLSEPPERVVPFAKDLTLARLSDNFSAWLRGVWLRPSDLKVEHLLSRTRSVYWPMWLVDGRVVGAWQARMGFDYQVESSQERFQEDRGWQTQRLIETRVRWEPRAGWIDRDFENLAVAALEEQSETRITARLGAYQFDRSLPYSPKFVTDSLVLIPTLLPEAAWPLARAAFDKSAAQDCQTAAGAQHSDEFDLALAYRDLNWTRLLLPAWATYYEDDAGNRIPVWVHGQSGQIEGGRRASLRKAWRVAGGMALAALFSLFLGGGLVLLKFEAVAMLFMMVGFFLLLLAILPVAWAWQYNQRQR